MDFESLFNFEEEPDLCFSHSASTMDGYTVYTNLTDPLSGHNGSQPCSPGPDIDFNLDLNSTYTGRTRLSGPHTFFAVLLPIIVIVGLVGNLLSLLVFLSTGMRKQPASYYLVAISISDMTVLLVYVLVKWIQDGLPNLVEGETLNAVGDALAADGVCQIQLYIAHMARFLSVWLIVVFTCERYIGVCHPFKKLAVCTSSWSRKVILSLVVVSIVVCIYKPIMSGNEVIHETLGTRACTTRSNYRDIAVILDAIYGFLITIVPFVLIFVLNTLMAHKLCMRNRAQREATHMSPDATMKMEFTFILLALSTTFLVLNLPYFVVWCVKFVLRPQVTLLNHHQSALLADLFMITKPIFFINYCINFFLYSVTGAYFRRELKMMCVYKPKQKGLHRRLTLTNSYSSNLTAATHTHQSWV